MRIDAMIREGKARWGRSKAPEAYGVKYQTGCNVRLYVPT